MKQFTRNRILIALSLIACSLAGYASSHPLEKAPPKHSNAFDIQVNAESFTVSNLNAICEPFGGPLPPVLSWNFKNYSLVTGSDNLSAYLVDATVWVDRQPAWGDNWKVIRFRNYYKTISPFVASKSCDKPIRLARSGYIRHTSNC